MPFSINPYFQFALNRRTIMYRHFIFATLLTVHLFPFGIIFHASSQIAHFHATRTLGRRSIKNLFRFLGQIVETRQICPLRFISVGFSSLFGLHSANQYTMRRYSIVASVGSYIFQVHSFYQITNFYLATKLQSLQQSVKFMHTVRGVAECHGTDISMFLLNIFYQYVTVFVTLYHISLKS